MKPSYEDMMVFLTVADVRSFTAAANRMGRTKSAISQSVNRLESDLGMRLLHRSTRSLSLTEAGARLLPYCQDIAESYQSAQNEMAQTNAAPVGTLTVTAPHSLCASYIVPAITAFREKVPNVHVRLLADDASIDLIESQVDVAIRIGAPKLQTQTVSKIGSLKESLYASAFYIELKGGIPKDIVEIQDWNHLANDWQGSPVRYDMEGTIQQIRVVPHIRCTNAHDVLALAREHQGVARLVDMLAAPSVDNSILQRLCALPESPIYMLHHYGKTPPASVRVFRDALREQF